METEHVKGAHDKASGDAKDIAGRQEAPKFDKALGSSHNDEADLRDVARAARNKSK